jgi:ammonium transporter Rh
MMRPFVATIAFLQTMALVLFFALTESDADPSRDNAANEYTIFRDIMVMLLLGFGYLMTFLKHYGLGAVGLTLLLSALAIQLNLLMEPLAKFLYHQDDVGTPLTLSIASLIDGEFSAATLLISFGAVIGRASPLQLVIMGVLQSFFYAVNKVVLVFGVFKAEDVGGTLTIHLFGAYFGIAVARAFAKPKAVSDKNNSSSQVSDVLSLIGTTVLWIYWPSFVGATVTASPEQMQLCILHTVMALVGSTIATFLLSQLIHAKFDPVLVANSTLAGGVAVGASARLEMTPGGALLLGLTAGLVSVLGYEFVSPLFARKLQIYDSCGVHNLHGLPALLGGLASAIFVTTDSHATFLEHGRGVQAGYQVAAVMATVAVALVSGWFTGGVMMMAVDEHHKPEYNDAAFWQTDYFVSPQLFPPDRSGRSLDRSGRSLDRSGRSKAVVVPATIEEAV